MIAFVQPFGLHAPGGGSRILRAMLEDAPEPYVSIATSWSPPPPTLLGEEIHLPLLPRFGGVERTRIGRHLWRAYVPFIEFIGRRFERALTRVFQDRGVTRVHAIPHGWDFWYAFRAARRLGLPFVLNVHDELSYNMRAAPQSFIDGAVERLARVWPVADGCMVISEAMGEEYCRRYGDRTYEVVTDGLSAIEKAPCERPENSLRVYMMGLVHLSYEANFRALTAGLDRIRERYPEITVSLTARGGFPFPVGSERVDVHALPWGTEDDVRRDLEEADILYLPLPFEKEFEPFVRYSLSTKMVTYLGSGLPIAYHGPAGSAAGDLLAQHDAAGMIPSLDADVVARELVGLAGYRDRIVENALALGRDQFRVEDQQTRFWAVLSPPGRETHAMTAAVASEVTS